MKKDEFVIRISRFKNGGMEFESPRLNQKSHGLLKLWKHDGTIWIQNSYRNGARIEFEYLNGR